MITQGIQNLRTSQDMETDKQYIIRQQHESRELIRDFRFAERIVAEIADILDLRMFHDELVHGDTGDPEHDAGDDHGDYSWHPAEDAQGPCLCHDSQTDLVAGEEPGGLLPRHGAEFDVMLVIFGDEGGDGVDGGVGIGINGFGVGEGVFLLI